MKDIAKYLETTNLKHTATRQDIKTLVDEAINHGFGGICVAPCWVNFVQNRLASRKVTDIDVVTVPNWKLGGGIQQCEGITDSLCESCDHVDYIWNCYEFGDLKDWEKTKKELKIMRDKTKGKLKVIIEAWYLRMMDEKIHKQGINSVLKEACKLVNKSGADYIKTDSGLFGRPDFDTLYEDCKILVKYSKLPVKAAGGIRDRYQADKLIELGVARLGTSSAIEIVTSDANI